MAVQSQPDPTSDRRKCGPAPFDAFIFAEPDATLVAAPHRLTAAFVFRLPKNTAKWVDSETGAIHGASLTKHDLLYPGALVAGTVCN